MTVYILTSRHGIEGVYATQRGAQDAKAATAKLAAYWSDDKADLKVTAHGVVGL